MEKKSADTEPLPVLGTADLAFVRSELLRAVTDDDMIHQYPLTASLLDVWAAHKGSKPVAETKGEEKGDAKEQQQTTSEEQRKELRAKLVQEVVNDEKRVRELLVELGRGVTCGGYFQTRKDLSDRRPLDFQSPGVAHPFQWMPLKTALPKLTGILSEEQAKALNAYDPGDRVPLLLLYRTDGARAVAHLEWMRINPRPLPLALFREDMLGHLRLRCQTCGSKTASLTPCASCSVLHFCSSDHAAAHVAECHADKFDQFALTIRRDYIRKQILYRPKLLLFHV